MRILAVDDDPIVLELLNSYLREEDNYFLTCCGSAEEAMDVVNDPTQSFDCFLLDIMLPGVSGVELCETLRGMGRFTSTPILVITGSREVGLMKKVFLAGATDFITKPLNGVELGARINTAGMLNASLLREEQARHSLGEMTQAMKLEFEEPVHLTVKGMSEMLALENDLLRLGPGVFALELFGIEVDQMRGIYRTVKPAEFRNCLDQIARASVAALQGTNCRLAYAGAGKFVGIVMGRARLKGDEVMVRINRSLVTTWDKNTSGVPMAPELLVKPLSDKRLWTAESAGACLREHTIQAEPFISVSSNDETTLFSRLDVALGATA